MRFAIFSVLLLCSTIWSCDRENFDENTATSESFTPIATELPFYTWAVGIDTVPLPLDSTWITGALEEELRIFVGYSNIDYSPLVPTQEAFFMDFTAVVDWPIPEGNYDLQRLRYERQEFNSSTNLWEVAVNQIWSGDQIEGVVELSEVEQRFDTYWNIDFWEHTGFASGVLTNPDGTTHEFSSAFHRVR